MYDPVTGKRKRFVNNQRVVSEEQMEPELLRYCNVDTCKYRDRLTLRGHLKNMSNILKGRCQLICLELGKQ